MLRVHVHPSQVLPQNISSSLKPPLQIQETDLAQHLSDSRVSALVACWQLLGRGERPRGEITKETHSVGPENAAVLIIGS